MFANRYVSLWRFLAAKQATICHTTGARHLIQRGQSDRYYPRQNLLDALSKTSQGRAGLEAYVGVNESLLKCPVGHLQSRWQYRVTTQAQGIGKTCDRCRAGWEAYGAAWVQAY